MAAVTTHTEKGVMPLLESRRRAIMVGVCGADTEARRVKLIVAVIQPTKLVAVREALASVEVERMTVCDSQGFGRQKGHTEIYRGQESTRLIRKIVLEVVVNDDFLDRTVETIAGVARTGPEGAIGDGKIFVLPADEAVQVNDGARGPGAA